MASPSEIPNNSVSPSAASEERNVKLSDAQLIALRHCVAMAGTRGDGEWLNLAGLGIGRATIRALQRAGFIEPREEGYPGQAGGRHYRVTESGKAAATTGMAL